MNQDMGRLDRRGLARGLKIFLDVLFYLALVVGGILRLVALGVSALPDYDDGWELNVPVAVGEGSFWPRLQLEVPPNPSPALQNIRIENAQGELRYFHHDFPLHLREQAIAFLFVGLSLWGITLLRRILATTAGGHPFDPINPRRLNTLGWIILSSSALASLLQFLVGRSVLSGLEVTTIPLSPHADFQQEWLLCGLLVLVLAGIWKEAVRMAEEQSLTV